MADLEWVRTFLAVYRSGSLSRAARSLHLTQPAVSQHIKALEQTIGQPLFHRLPRGVSATPAGNELARTAGSHVDALETLLSVSKTNLESLAGTVHLGGPADLIATKVVPLFAPALRHHIRVRVHLGLTETLIDALAEGELDLVIATQRATKASIEYERLWEEEFVLVASPELAARFPAKIKKEQLVGAPWIAFSEDLPIIRRWFRTVFHARIDVKAAVVVEDLRAILRAVAAGLGISVLPRYLCREALDRGELFELYAPPAANAPKNTLFLARRRGGARHPRVAIVQDLLLRDHSSPAEGSRSSTRRF